MLNALGNLIKLALFTVAILFAGQWIQWEGRPLASHVNRAIHQALNSEVMDRFVSWSKSLTRDAQEGAKKYSKGDEIRLRASAPQRSEGEDITSSERQKLRELIRELNSKSR
jgi:hypothetical protein